MKVTEGVKKSKTPEEHPKRILKKDIVKHTPKVKIEEIKNLKEGIESPAKNVEVTAQEDTIPELNRLQELKPTLINLDTDFKVTRASIKPINIEHEEIAMEESTVTEVKEKKQSEIRILYKKCAVCSYLMSWEENIYECIEDPECPAKRMSIVYGRDPVKLIDMMSDQFAEALSTGNKDSFMEILKKMVKDKNLRNYVYESFSESIVKLEERSLNKKIKEVTL